MVSWAGEVSSLESITLWRGRRVRRKGEYVLLLLRLSRKTGNFGIAGALLLGWLSPSSGASLALYFSLDFNRTGTGTGTRARRSHQPEREEYPHQLGR